MNRALLIGTILYMLAACADSAMTLHGMGGDIGLEGNPFVRRLMLAFGPAAALLLSKGATGLVCFAVAKFGEPEIKRRAPWIDKLPMFPASRRWLASGDRSWIAHIPLYGTALSQLAAAASWTLVR